MPDTYIPPFTMTDAITNLVIEVAELTGAMTVSEQLSKNPKLRRDNRIKSIHSSLAIEQNTLTEEQVSDVIDGKRVLGPPLRISEKLKMLMKHTLILAKWQEFFLWIPIETIIHARQNEYYKALNASNTEGESTIFVQFMLELIRDLLKELSHNGVMNQAKTVDEKLLVLLTEDGNQSAARLAKIVGSSPRTVQRALKRLMDKGKIEHIGSNRFGHYIVK